MERGARSRGVRLLTNKIYNVDCIEGMKELYEEHGECIDLCVTDPPYGIDYQSNGSLKKKSKLVNDDIPNYKTFGGLVYKLLKPNSHAYFFTRFDVYPEHHKQLTEVGFNIKNLIVAEKMQAGGLGDLKGSFANNIEMVIFAHKGRRIFNKTKLIKNEKPAGKRLNRYANPTNEYKTRFPVLWKVSDGYPPAVLNSSQNKGNPHPTPKNPKFLEWLLQLSSDVGDVVIDPFIGGGSLAEACVNTGRNYIGYELDESFYNYANERISNLLVN
ncbi:DNA-methyltransferase [Siminovitchia sp. 179-K 8D1 HS]|uniref:DNA-methyltransferase n=1 Tax=Siminovitchia sp. 179-K 8D1 HS TaxID=3142385 RepID=UPI0039A152A7